MTDRADRLGVAMLAFGLVRERPLEALRSSAECALLTADELDAWRECDDEDLALAQACLVAEFELRARQWDALERLGAALSNGSGETTDERVATMPEADAREALRSALALNWDLPTP